MQLAINAPFGLLWVADKTNPAVHAFYISVLAALQIQNNEEVAANDVRNAAMLQQRIEDARAPLKEGEAPDASILPAMASEVITE